MITKKLTALLLTSLVFSAQAFAADCSTEIEGNDAMQYNKSRITISKSCPKFTVTIKHVGKLPKVAMGHNWVLSKTADLQAIATEGMTAGLDKDYIKAGETRVIAHTKTVGPGESDSVTFDVSKLSSTESYSYFCTFPGHFGVMKGTIQLVD